MGLAVGANRPLVDECSNQTGSLFGLLRQIMPIEPLSPLESLNLNQ
jgi:hypothetical protein